MLNSIVVSSSTGYIYGTPAEKWTIFNRVKMKNFSLTSTWSFFFSSTCWRYIKIPFRFSFVKITLRFLPWKNGFDMILQLLCLTIVLFGDSIKPLKFSLFCQFLVNFSLSVISGQIRHFSGIFYSFCLCHQFEENTRYGNRAKINFKDLGP